MVSRTRSGRMLLPLPDRTRRPRRKTYEACLEELFGPADLPRISVGDYMRARADERRKAEEKERLPQERALHHLLELFCLFTLAYCAYLLREHLLDLMREAVR